ncbi:hypothetical protein R3P38DRAFT_3196287 [Favolaschia claudopus]|uniref:Uncharacterized protein n=1 Tax=Favolaschia claudopus TaxID=2862362 RepID=A0AAW0B7T9_9AGAR
MAEHTRKCSKCRKTKEVTPQTWKATFKEGGIHLTSINDPEKENEADNPTEDATDASEFIGVPAMVIDAFLDALTAADDIKLFTALVDVSALGKDLERQCQRWTPLRI